MGTSRLGQPAQPQPANPLAVPVRLPGVARSARGLTACQSDSAQVLAGLSQCASSCGRAADYLVIEGVQKVTSPDVVQHLLGLLRVGACCAEILIDLHVLDCLSKYCS